MSRLWSLLFPGFVIAGAFSVLLTATVETKSSGSKGEPLAAIQRGLEPARKLQRTRPSNEFVTWRRAIANRIPSEKRWWLTDTFGRTTLQVVGSGEGGASDSLGLAQEDSKRSPTQGRRASHKSRRQEEPVRRQDPKEPKRVSLEVIGEGGSPLPCGDGYTLSSPAWGRLAGSSGREGTILLVGEADAYDPVEFGLPDAIEFNIDTNGGPQVRVSFLIASGSSIFAAPIDAPRQRPTAAEGWTRLGGRTGLGRLRSLSGKERPHILGKEPVRFGLLLEGLVDLKGTGIDNFEVRVTSKCTPEMKAREAKEAQEVRDLNERILAKFRKLREVQDAGDWRTELQDEAPGRSHPQKPLVRKDCCSDEATDMKGDEIAAPPDTDWDVPVNAEFVETDNGPVDQIFPGVDTSTDDWYERFPCKTSVGDWVPPEIDALDANPTIPDIDPDAEKLGTIIDPIREWNKALEEETKNENLDFGTDKVAPPPPSTADPRWKPRIGRIGPQAGYHPYAFEGMDIVFVHGLELGHIQRALIDKFPAALETWKTSPLNVPADIVADNPQFFNNGYFANSARGYWFGNQTDSAFISSLSSAMPSISTGPGLGQLPGPRDGHIFRFLLGPGYRNRFMIASYSCADRMTNAVKAVLGQVGVAMTTGQGVYNPSIGNPGVHGFGRNGLVFVSHSTGGLLVDIAMVKAKEDPNLGASYIVDYTKAHVASAAIFGGSPWSSMLLLAGGAGAEKAYGLLPFFGPLNVVVALLGKYFDNWFGSMPLAFPNDLSTMAKPMKDTIVRDITIPHVAWHFKPLVKRCPVRTILVEGSNPDTYIAKAFVPGFDDSTTNSNSQGALRNPWWFFWPAGSLTAEPKKNFDLGLFGPIIKQKNLLPPIRFLGRTLSVTWGSTYTGQPVRALTYYLDQRIDPFVCNPLWLLLNVTDGTNTYRWKDYFQSSFVSPHLSPTGMLMGGVPLRFTPWSPYWRANNHFAYLGSAADHITGTIDSAPPRDIGSTDYKATFGIGSGFLQNYFQGPGGEANWEESFVVNNSKIYQAYDPPALAADLQLPTKMKNLPLLKTGRNPVHEWIRGLYLQFTLTKGGNVKWTKTKWFYKRYYYLIKDSQSMRQFDYVYRDVLRS